MRNAFAMQIKIKKCMHDPRTICLPLAAFKGNIYQKRVCNIDILPLDWAYKSSACDVMYLQQRRHIYYGSQI
jgi:hypothetical protein